MLNITHSSIFVLDQDEALDFYVGKLGFEVNADVDMGFMRWLTISAPGDPDREILLERPGPPAHDDATAEQVRELVTKGAAGFALGLRTDDCRKTYEELKAKGVEFTEEPTERFYGDRLRAARPVRQQHPHRAARARAARSPRPRRVRPELRAMVAGPAGTPPAAGAGPRRPPLRRAARRPRARARRAPLPRALQPRVRARVRRDPAPLPADAPARARGRAAAHAPIARWPTSA